jgi:hypothetical protein
MNKKTAAVTFSIAMICLLFECTPPVTETPATEPRKLTASDAATSDSFGRCVAISDDYVLVSADSEDGAGANRGAAYLFYRHQGGTDNWGEIKKLMASDAEDGDCLGSSVALMGTYAVVGADCEDGAGTDRGAAYLFSRDKGGADNWGEIKKLTASDAADDDYFGNSVAIWGDYVLVGAYFADTSAGPDRGTAYLFYRNQGGADNWGEIKKLTSSSAGFGDYFGNSVALCDEFALVGAYAENGAGIDRGAAYVFYRYQGGIDNWGEQKKLTAGDGENGDYFGNSVALYGDYALVGACDEDGAGVDRGAAYIFHRNMGGPSKWGEVKKLTASDGTNGDGFGISTALFGDDVIVGAMCKTTPYGEAYHFSRNQGGADNWGEVKQFTPEESENHGAFGCSVTLSSSTVLVGAFGEGVGGSVYVYKRE